LLSLATSSEERNTTADLIINSPFSSTTFMSIASCGTENLEAIAARILSTPVSNAESDCSSFIGANDDGEESAFISKFFCSALRHHAQASEDVVAALGRDSA
jgi:hypothetical protein